MTTSHRRHTGFSLIEVMIAVVVLSFGLLALAALQSSLFRAGAESKARANATSLAQHVIEQAKGFAYANPVTGYAGGSYMGLATQSIGSQTVGAVTYTVCREVRRYRMNAGAFVRLNDVANCADSSVTAAAFNPKVPEFKEVRVRVTWTDDRGETSTVEVTDSVSAISPSDAARVVRAPSSASPGPQVWIVPPNQGNPQVVPIAIGNDQSAASSNPKPEQFVEDVVAATLFSIHTFTGSTQGQEVRLNRKLDVAAVSCECQAGGTTSTTQNPAYQATQWSGKQLSYLEPQAVPAGARIGTAVVSNANAEISAMCTVCCRDHHEVPARQPKPDPYRVRTSGDSENYTYATSGQDYNLSALVAATETGRYLDSCQLVRVNGRMRMAVDAQMNHLLVTPLSDSPYLSYRNSSFVSRLSGLVSGIMSSGMASLPAGYPSPTARFPAPGAALLQDYADIDDPDALPLVEGDTRKLVAFGLYVDYINDETKHAYNCAVAQSNAGNCAGLGSRNPLEVLPFYAVNVANLGDWASAKPRVADVAGAGYDNKGLLISDGGLITAYSDASTDPFRISLSIGASNSGLAGTVPVDPHDRDSVVQDGQRFTKQAGASGGSINRVTLQVNLSAGFNLKSLSWSAPCTYASKTATATCTFKMPVSSLTTRVSNYQAVSKAGVLTENRKICRPSVTGVSSTVNSSGMANESTDLTFTGLSASDVNHVVHILPESTACPSGTISP